MQFNFGKNWKNFSENALNQESIDIARFDFDTLTEGIVFKNKTFLDIGFGQGLSIMIATEKGAQTAGNDINPLCHETLVANRKFFPNISNQAIPVVVGSILDSDVVQAVRQNLGKGNNFDIVHSWGVLHHTGNMEMAFKNADSLLNAGGFFITAIYNKHWSSKPWLFIKWFYCKMPAFIQQIMIYGFIPIIALAKYVVTGKNPFKQRRGMSFYYDIIDWVGGYPYEYASIAEMNAFMEKMGYTCIRSIPAKVPTGCNQMVYKKGKKDFISCV